MANQADPIEAELAELDAEDGRPPPSAVRRFLPVVLALITLSGFAGVVWYAYSTGIREGSEGAAPILKVEGPSKVAPKSPGGETIPDQDKLVYGKIDKTAGGRKVERLLPPPENPLPVPIAKTPPLPTPKLDVPNAPPTSELPPPPSITGPRDTSGEPPVEKTSEAEALADVEPSAGTPAPTEPETAAVAAPPRPVAVAPKPPPQVAKAVPAPDPSSGFRIQTGSLRSEEAAKLAWAKQVKQHGAVLSKLTLLVKRADLGKRGVYYRVQAGPLTSKAAAQRICDELKQKKTGCFVVKP